MKKEGTQGASNVTEPGQAQFTQGAGGNTPAEQNYPQINSNFPGQAQGTQQAPNLQNIQQRRGGIVELVLDALGGVGHFSPCASILFPPFKNIVAEESKVKKPQSPLNIFR